jgi:glycine oxidase
MGTNGADAVVVGGGLIGCIVARALAGEGLAVTIVERGKVGREASHDAAGMLAPQAETVEPGPFLDLGLESRALYPALAEEHFADVGADVRYRDEGTFLAGFSDEEAERLEALATRQRALGLDAEVLGAAAARRAEPALAPNVRLVVSIPGDHQVDNRKLVEAVALACYARGVSIVEHSPVRGVVRDAAGRVRGVATTGGEIAADLVVVAAGCWSNLVEGFSVPVEPVKGQMLMLELTAPPCRRVLRSERCYVVARIDGRVLIGATMERVGYDKTVSPAAVGVLLESGREIAPSLGASHRQACLELLAEFNG